MKGVPLVLVVVSMCGLGAAGAQAQVVNPKTVEFDPSADHAALTSGNEPLVQRYQLQIFAVGASAPISTADLGKPAPQADGKIRVDFSALVSGWPLGDGTYIARVAAVGPSGSGTSDPSNTFSFASCSITLGGSSQSVLSGGAAGSVSVTAGSSCSWTASSDAAWVTLGTTGSTGSGTVGFVVAENLGAVVRVATLTIGGHAFTITQAAAVAACTYSLSSSSQSFSQGNGSGSVTVSCASACAWSVSTSAAWITLASSGGTGPGTLGYTVAKNTTPSPRTGTIAIAGLPYTVSQDAGKVPSAPKKVRLSAIGG